MTKHRSCFMSIKLFLIKMGYCVFSSLLLQKKQHCAKGHQCVFIDKSYFKTLEIYPVFLLRKHFGHPTTAATFHKSKKVKCNIFHRASCFHHQYSL